MDGVGAGLARGAHVLGRVEIGGDLDERVRRLGMERAEVVGAATATVSMPSARQARKMRSAISPRLATSRRRIGPESRHAPSRMTPGDSVDSALPFLV